jgi:hypothetical protein
LCWFAETLYTKRVVELLAMDSDSDWVLASHSRLLLPPLEMEMVKGKEELQVVATPQFRGNRWS